ncbi:S24 family peptidase [Yunchengibacter salinarum]|uniref:S24 family peptidase n=1 Tax=Yunchengibacter salinarum TaxID=3133399 RepID=UPI0035B67B66
MSVLPPFTSHHRDAPRKLTAPHNGAAAGSSASTPAFRPCDHAPRRGGPGAGRGTRSLRRRGLPGTRPRRIQRTLPVLGRAQGGEDGALILGEGPIGWARRPSGLDHVAEAFAVFITGDSMAPLLRGGDLVHVDPRPTAASGDLVLVETRYHTGYIKFLESRSHEALVLRQTNPEKRLRFTADDIRHVFKVVGWQGMDQI